MWFSRWFDLNRKIRDLEDTISGLVEELDSQRQAISSLNQGLGGLRSTLKRWHGVSSSNGPETFVDHLERVGQEEQDSVGDATLSEKEFVDKHGVTPKVLADMMIREGRWV